jgi:hypothetical protein
MTVEFSPTRLYWTPRGGEPADLSQSVGTIRMQVVDPEEPRKTVISTGWFKPVTFRGSALRLTPLGYRVLVGRTHPRVRRMHAAYGRRRGHR